MEERSRQQAFIYLAAAIICVVLLAVGLPSLKFMPGQPIPGAPPELTQAQPNSQTFIESEIQFPKSLQIAFLVGFVFVFILLFIYLVKKTNWKTALLFLVGLVILAAMAVVLSQLGGSESIASFESSETMELQGQLDFKIAPIGEPPANLAWIVAGGLLLLVIFVMVRLIVKNFQLRKHENPLGREAARALQAIEEGQDLRDVILRSYQQMIRCVDRERGIERQESVTPREFEELLISNGIPAEPTRQLTRLFEKVRYGGKPPDAQDKRVAVACLSAIRAACQAGKGAAE